MIIDAHVHLWKTDKIDRFYTPESYFAEAEKWGIEKAICMPNVGSLNNLNKKMWDIIPEYKKKIFAFLLINEEGYPQIIHPDIYGYKYHPSISQRPIDELDLFNNTPYLIHCGRHPISHISFLIRAAKKYPATLFIAAHLGGNASELADQAIDEVSKSDCNNIWMDTSGIKLPCLIRKAVDKLGSEKILFGTDVPYGDIRLSMACVRIARLSSAEEEKVFSLNVRGLLGE